MSSSPQPVPPAPSSHTSPAPVVIRIPRLALLAVALLAFGAAFPVFGWPRAFGWLMLIPLATLWWVLRVRTVVSAAGLVTRDAFRSHTIAWEDIKGVRFPKRGYARAVRTDGTETQLQAVSFDRLPDLAAASHGHIPDPYAVGSVERVSPVEHDPGTGGGRTGEQQDQD